MAFVIDPTARTVLAVDYGDPVLEPLKTSDPILLNVDTGDVIYEGVEGDTYSVLEGVRRPLRGKLLVVGTTEDGDDCEPKVSLQDLCKNIDFGVSRDGIYYGDSIVRAVR